MASISSISGSSTTSSLYNSANIISGLASGMDTEGMIENLVKSYQTKIQNLSNKATKIEWKQEAYRSIISKMYAFSSKYASYSSATNLLSSSFFSNAIKVAAMGANKDKVTASGRTESNVKLNSVKQLATAARYNTQSNLKNIDNNFSITAEKAINLSDEIDRGALSGSLVLQYGNDTVSVVFNPSTDMVDDYVYKTDKDGNYVLDENGKRIVERTRTKEEKAEDLQKIIQKKLEESSITLSNGESRKASEMISVTLDGSSITFGDKSTGGNEIYISSASGTVGKTLGLDLKDADENKPTTFSIDDDTKLVNTYDVGTYISRATMNISLDGKVKTIQLPNTFKTYDGYDIITDDGEYIEMTGELYVKTLQEALDKEFGKDKIKVSNVAEGDDPTALKLSFKAPDNSDLIINTNVGDALGIGDIATNYLNTNETLGDLMEKDAWDNLEALKGVGEPIEKGDKLYDVFGREVDEDGDLIDNNGNKLYAFKINGVTIGNYTKDTKLSTIMSDINSNTEAAVKVTYSQTTRQFSFVSKDTGSENDIKLGEGLAQAIFGAPGSKSDSFAKDIGLNLEDDITERIAFEGPDGSSYAFDVTNKTTMQEVVDELNNYSQFGASGYTFTYNETSGKIIMTDKDGKAMDFKMGTADEDGNIIQERKSQNTSSYIPGRDAIFTVEVNGQELQMTRGSNSANIDGMTLTFKDTFNEDYKIGDRLETEAVTFHTSTDSDQIVDAVKSMITDYNEMMAEIKSAYATLPYKSSSGAFQSYEPLTDEDRATMSESAIQNYEAKAKQGILFNDYNLSSLYQRLNDVFNLSGEDGNLLKQMGITRTYSVDGSSYMTLDENKLRNALDNDLDAVADLFTRSADAGGSSNGIMQTMKTQLDRYGSITGSVKGILVQQAGTPLSSLSLLDNEWQKQIDSLGNQIEKWQDKLSAQVDRYTSMFSRLEVLMNQMNSQSSTLASLMAGGTGGGY